MNDAACKSREPVGSRKDLSIDDAKRETADTVDRIDPRLPSFSRRPGTANGCPANEPIGKKTNPPATRDTRRDWCRDKATALEGAEASRESPRPFQRCCRRGARDRRVRRDG